MPRPTNHTRQRPATRHPQVDPTSGIPSSHWPPRTYTVFDTTPGGYREYPSTRFIVTSEGELILIHVSSAGIDQYIAAVYAEGAWRSIHAFTRPELLHPLPSPLDPDEPPAS